ncbi:efflux RND transporter permease subunit [Aurantimonas sp. C2-6-R+9]|uniref:efflux RND transporter permease subunit n=1 Tax=unclassified Aurantimonas TaxID=2638230 RepID=UPI002E1818FE|nr:MULTISPECIES: efflux RND transporter permease subunit [unclassified Aurantimonas]MEC5290401.1 efflux RND transporter permease subunit [Aurantimonas sp. C2-3-R2]MEC5380591.1 efflux RND transporter permease subunit [Aurantimonas sp. C2-6-R+9]MEC5411569.1 efflux RND transporter permease subunit [Aurantimonas sp. C2-4-R8]
MIRWFAAHPTAANLLLIVFLAAGAIAAPQLKRETFPDFLPTEVSIAVLYRGATAADVEESVCQRLEEGLRRVDYMEEFRCSAEDNLANALAKMTPGGTASQFLDDIKTEVEAITDFPDLADAPVIREMHRTDQVAALAVSGDMSFDDLERYAAQLEDAVLALPDVADVMVRGVSQRQWQVEVSADLLRQYGLSVRDIAGVIGRQNVDMPLGTLETPQADVQLRFTDQRRRIADLADLIVISGKSAAELRLGEIAELTDGFEKAEEKILFNGERALVLDIYKSGRTDALSVMDRLQEFVALEQARRGAAVRLTITTDMTSIVRDRLVMLVENGIMGLVLVTLVMSLFFRVRMALWGVLGLPVAFAGAFVAMALLGLSINMITLVAFLMAIGIVMDDAVVITDNVARCAAEGQAPLAAVVNGTREVLPGVMSSFLTTAAVFVPLSFLSGELGAVLEVVPIVLVAALAASLIEAFWILPHHLKGGRKGPESESRLRRTFDKGFARFQSGVGALADRAIRARYITLAAMLALLLGSVGFIAGGNIRMEAMPDIDGDVLEARILMPQGTPLARTEAVVEQVTAALLSVDEALTPDQPEGAALVRSIRADFNRNLSAGESGPHVATVSADLLTAEIRATSLDDLTTRWREAIGPIDGLVSLMIQEPGFGPAGVPIEIRLKNSDLSRLDRAAAELAGELATYAGVYNVITDLRPGKPQRRLSLAPGAAAAGLSAADVAEQLRTDVLGDIVETVQIGDLDIDIVVRQSRGERATYDFLTDTVVIGPNGAPMPLPQVTEVEAARDWAKINRIDGQRTVTVSAQLDQRVANAGAIVADLQTGWLASLPDRYPDIGVAIEGQAASTAETGASIARGLAIGLLGIFLILSFQFRSYLEPVIVMLAIPLAFMGAIWGHVLMGYNLSMPSLVGAASLAGIVVNNSILLVQFIKSYRSEGMGIEAAAGQASRARLRAILISSTTTAAGLLPLLAETSTQATAVIPLVIAVVFGLVVSTVLVLIGLPALYVILDDLGLAQVETPDGSQKPD